MALETTDKQWLEEKIERSAQQTREYLETKLGERSRELRTQMTTDKAEVLAAIADLKEQETEDVSAAYIDAEKLDHRVTRIEKHLGLAKTAA